jgi:branched-chain amino acid transport system substrate-binding protein
MQQNGRPWPKRVESFSDDAANPTPPRLAQELVVNEKVNVLAGFGLTPLALATAPIATEAKVPEIVMAAGTSIITERSPYIVRTSFTVPQSCVIVGEWAVKNNIKKVVTLVSDYAPGHDAETSFSERFKANGGEIVAALRVPLQNPDFAPFLQRAADAKPDAIFVFVPSGAGAIVMKQFVERGLARAGMRMIGPGDITDDDILPGYGDVALGIITAHFYATAHPSAKNKAYVEAFTKAIPACGRTSCRSAAMTYAHDLQRQEDRRQSRRRFAGSGDEGDVGKPARPDHDRSRYTRHHSSIICARSRRSATSCRTWSSRPSRP